MTKSTTGAAHVSLGVIHPLEHDWHVSNSFITNWCGKAKPALGCVIPGHLDLSKASTLDQEAQIINKF